MGCGIDYLVWLCEKGILKSGDKVFDIGEQCLLSDYDNEITREKLRKIFTLLGLKRKNPEGLSENNLEEYIFECSWRSTLRGHDTVPTLFLGDVLTKTTVEYAAIDICSARYAEIFDLNTHFLAPIYHNSFDLVLNFGTTEHIINQYNCFKVMHDACRPGGYILSQIPASGWVGHGYFNYDPLLFSDLARANKYKIHALWFNSGGGDVSILEHAAQFPSMLDTSLISNEPDKYQNKSSSCYLLNVILQKTSAEKFFIVSDVRTAAASLFPVQEYKSKYIDFSQKYCIITKKYFFKKNLKIFWSLCILLLMKVPAPIKNFFPMKLKKSMVKLLE